MLADARARIRRYTPEEARTDPDLLLVDMRCDDDRHRDGVVATHVPYSVIQWRDEELVGRRLCLVCRQGYSSSLAAAALVELGVDAGDSIGGYEAW